MPRGGISPATSRETGEIAEIDGLRGIAICLVMLHRLWPRTPAPGFAEYGWIGVDLFFIVSGFLITRILLATREDPEYFRNFYARRVLRIFPLYYLFVGAILAAGSVGLHAQAGSSTWYLLFLGNVPEGVLGLDPPYWLAPVWSLAIEEQFYLTFPLLVRRLDRRQLARVLGTLIVLAPVVRAVTFALWPERERIQYLFTLCRLDAIAAGCGLALIASSQRFAQLRGAFAAIASAAGLVALAYGLDRTTPFGRIAGYSAVALGLAGVVGLVLLARDQRATSPLRWRWLRYLGRLCFGLYLLHRPADTLTNALAARLGVDATVGALWVPIKIAVAVGLASVSWFVLERRLLRLKHYFASSLHPVRQTSAAAIATTTLLVGCSFRPGSALAASDGAAPDLTHIAFDARPPVDTPDATIVPVPAIALYTFDRRHSPITLAIAQHLQAIAAHNAASSQDVFAKVGDSITAMPAFATCFDGGFYALATHSALAPTVSYYLHGNAAGASPFARVSDAALGGWTAADLLAGSPAPVDRELAAIAPRVALVMIGTNDNRYGRTLSAYGIDLWTVVDRLIAAGAVPALSTIPPIFSDPTADARVAVFDLVVRAIAQGRQVPLVDLYREMVALPNEGIGADGMHPSVSPDGACDFSAADLQYGFDLRNLMELEQLERVREALSGQPCDLTAVGRVGSGRAGDPILARLPLADLADAQAGDPAYAFTACPPASTGSHQLVYAVALSSPATIDAYAFDRGGDVALHLLVGGSTASSCIAGGQGEVTAALPAGTSYLVASGDGEVVVVAHAL
jgi:peptidoglycan/LPS O-acetylase OafA/YrhL